MAKGFVLVRQLKRFFYHSKTVHATEFSLLTRLKSAGVMSVACYRYTKNWVDKRN